jgi:hypothetical protein
MRSASQIIDQIINENKNAERFLYSFAGLFILLGAGIIILGAVNNHQITTLAGCISTCLFWPALNFARQIRRENIFLRLLERSIDAANSNIMVLLEIQRLAQDGLRGKTPIIGKLKEFRTRMRRRRN